MLLCKCLYDGTLSLVSRETRSVSIMILPCGSELSNNVIYHPVKRASTFGLSEPETTGKLEESVYTIVELAWIEVKFLKTYVPRLGLIFGSIVINRDREMNRPLKTGMGWFCIGKRKQKNSKLLSILGQTLQ